MNVLGISGLDNSVAFKRRMFPDLDPREYRIAQGFDAAAALCTPAGIRAAASEERFTREKATNAFPISAMKYCLRAAGLRPADVEFLAHGFSYDALRDLYESDEFARAQYREVYSSAAQVQALERHWPGVDWAARFVPVAHHDAHAASAYYPSGFEDALIVVWDGMGEQHATTIAAGEGGAIRHLRQIAVPHSIGLLYGVCTLYLGFSIGMDEYKVMGLAPYGQPDRLFARLMPLVDLLPDGSYHIPLLARGSTLLARETYREVLGELVERLGPARTPEFEITARHCDIAAALQAVLERTVLHVLRHFRDATGLTNLCLAGGVALNCSANGVVKRSGLFRNVFVQPAAGDDGTAVGAALQVQRTCGELSRPCRMTMPFWGPSYDDEQIRSAIERASGSDATAFGPFEDLARHVVSLLVEGRIVGWFGGRMEFGPRALGNRSILADPRPADMRDRINALVKKREAFRPFAPAVPEEHASAFFEIENGDEPAYAHMLLVTHVRSHARTVLPAVTHVDGSARVQVVRRREQPRFWRLLNEFGRATGVPILLNTSLNVRGEPIVCSPDEAIRTFLAAGLDALVIGNHVLTRRAA